MEDNQTQQPIQQPPINQPTPQPNTTGPIVNPAFSGIPFQPTAEQLGTLSPIDPSQFIAGDDPTMAAPAPQPTPQPQPAPQPVPQPVPTPQPAPQPVQVQPAPAPTPQPTPPQPAPQPTPASQPAKPATPAPKPQSLSTQANLLISELRDGVVIMKDGSFRAVIACKSINFDLMSEQEREGVEYSYQNFINSLNFTTQILVRSQRIDIAPYLERLTEIRKNTDNMLLGVLMDDYINFIDILSQEANIMDKSFFIIVPYYTSADAEKVVQQTKNLFKSFSKQKTPEVTKIDRNTYDQALTEINNRVDVIVSGLFQIGIHSVRLNTKELSELYYNFNNPDTAVREPFIDFSKLATTYVRKGDQNA